MLHGPSISRDTDDNNHYILGKIKLYNIVLAGLPSKKAGVISAVTIAKLMLSTFPSTKHGFGLMVGVVGGAPSIDDDIRLGDVIVSEPEERYGRSHPIGRWETGSRRQIPGHWSSKSGTRHSPKCPSEDESET